MHGAHARHASGGTHVHAGVALVALQRHERAGGAHVVLAAHVGDDGVGIVAPGGLAGVLELHVGVGGREAVLGWWGLEGGHEAGGGLLRGQLRGVLGLLRGRLVWDLGVVYYVVSVHLCLDVGFDVVGTVSSVERAHVWLNLRRLCVGIVLPACGIRRWSLGMTRNTTVHGVWLLGVGRWFGVGAFERVVVAICVVVKYVLVLLVLHWTSGSLC